MDTLHVFIGYDPREAVAYHACVNSLIRYSSKPLAIHPLALTTLEGYVENPRRLTGYKPSNEFIFSRFLVPHLMGYKGMAVFIDGDMVVRDDIKKLFDLHEWGKAVSVVKHDYKTKFPIKYMGQENGDYPRKNWSSVMLFHCEHFACKRLTPAFVGNASGTMLHRFEWCDDREVGELPMEWNWLPDEYGANEDAKLLHWTVGLPCFTEYRNTPQAEEWNKEVNLMLEPQ